ncbi:MAG TPA: MFS transporter, partial [Mycobacteriales bacterium]|nr:MFS transporter [Mycobacteriales bacterium]
GVLLVGRVIQGAGGAVFPLAFGIIRDEFPTDRVSGAIANVSALLAVGSGAGIVLAGPIVDNLGVNWVFWLPLALIIPAYVATLLFLPISPLRPSGRLSRWAVLLLAAFLITLLLGINQGPEWGWLSVGVWALFAAAVLLGIAWVRIELSSRVPLVDMVMMRIPTVAAANLNAFLFGFSMYATGVLIPQFVQTPSHAGYGFGASVTVSGLYLLPQTATVFVGGRIAGRYSETLGSKNLLIGGSAASFLSLFALVFAHDSAWEVIIAMATFGLGIGLAFGALPNLVIQVVDADQTGVATGMNANIRTVGGALGGTVTASLVASAATASGLPGIHGWMLAFVTLTAVAGVALLTALLVPSDRRTPDRQPELHHRPAKAV